MSGTGKIAELVRKLSAMSTPQFRYELNTALAEEAGNQYRADFKKQSDPYGKPWAPSFNVLSERYGTSGRQRGRTLVNTGYLRASGEAETVTAEGFRFRVYAPYGQFHQSGTAHMPQRMIIPTSALGLGRWLAPFNRVTVAKIRALLK